MLGKKTDHMCRETEDGRRVTLAELSEIIKAEPEEFILQVRFEEDADASGRDV